MEPIIPLPLAEPWFLRGRISVIERAVFISLVLGVMVTTAAWAARITLLYIAPASGILFLSIVLGAATSLAQAPLQMWNLRPVTWSIASFPLLSALYYLLFCFDTRIAGISPDLHFSICSILLLLVCGVLLVRLDAPHLLALIVSLTMVLLPCLLFELTTSPRFDMIEPGRRPLPRQAYQAAVSLGALYGLVLPWGIPFWMPPGFNADLEEPEFTSPNRPEAN